MQIPTKTTVRGGPREYPEDVGALAVKYTARTGHKILAACWGYDAKTERPIAVVIGR